MSTLNSSKGEPLKPNEKFDLLRRARIFVKERKSSAVFLLFLKRRVMKASVGTLSITLKPHCSLGYIENKSKYWKLNASDIKEQCDRNRLQGATCALFMINSKPEKGINYCSKTPGLD